MATATDPFPKRFTRDDLRREVIVRRLPLTDPQRLALARGANLDSDQASDEEIPSWWILEVDGDGKDWILLCGDTDVYGNPFDDPMADDVDVAPVWMDSKGHFRLGPGEPYDEHDELVSAA